MSYEQKLENLQQEVQRHREELDSQQSEGKQQRAYKFKKSGKGYTFENEEEHSTGGRKKRFSRMQSEIPRQSDDDMGANPKKNPKFGKGYGKAGGLSSDDDVPIGFGRRKRLSSQSS